MNYITVVIEYADGQKMPSFTANMPLLGGTITAVQFNDDLAELEELHWVEGKRCPRCGCSLVSDGKLVWCSFLGGDGQKACSYGLDGEDILLESV